MFIFVTWYEGDAILNLLQKVNSDTTNLVIWLFFENSLCSLNYTLAMWPMCILFLLFSFVKSLSLFLFFHIMCGTWNARWVGGDILESYFMNILCTDWILNSSGKIFQQWFTLIEFFLNIMTVNIVTRNSSKATFYYI